MYMHVCLYNNYGCVKYIIGKNEFYSDRLVWHIATRTGVYTPLCFMGCAYM